MIYLERCGSASGQDSIREYLRIKYRVFIQEQNWPLSGNHHAGVADRDAFDGVSRFVIAHSERGEAVGVVRGTMLATAMPHPELIGRYFEDPAFGVRKDSCATINSVAVLPSFRGKAVVINGWSRRMTVGKALMCEMVDWLREFGCRAVLLTTARATSAVFFEHLGFYVLDVDVLVDGMKGDFLNMGCVLDDNVRFVGKRSPLVTSCRTSALDTSAEACRAFMHRRHARILGESTIEAFVSHSEQVTKGTHRSGTLS